MEENEGNEGENNMSAICRTCGGEVPNHRPTILDPNGSSHPGHRMPITSSEQKIKSQRDTRYLAFAERLIEALPENREGWKTVIAQHVYDLVTPSEYIDSETKVRMLIEHDNPGYPDHPKVTITCPEGHQLSFEQVNAAIDRLSELARLPIPAMGEE
jgi:hypothetical protein